MKKRLTLSIDPDVVTMAKRYAQSRGMSLSALVEQYLVKQTRLGRGVYRLPPGAANSNRQKTHGDPRYDFLAKKYLD